MVEYQLNGWRYRFNSCPCLFTNLFYFITNEIINIFNSKADAAEYLCLRRRIIDSITRAIKTKSLYKGYYWKEEVKILNQNK